MLQIRLTHCKNRVAVLDKLNRLVKHLLEVNADKQNLSNWGRAVAYSLGVLPSSYLDIGEDASLLGDVSSSGEETTEMEIQAFRSRHLCLIVDGDSLLNVFGDSEAESLLLDVGLLCQTVIACRVSPEQKKVCLLLMIIITIKHICKLCIPSVTCY